MAGDFMAYAFQEDGEDCHTGVEVIDGRTGMDSAPQVHRCGYWTRFKRVVVLPNGAVAWSERVSIIACRSRCAELRPPDNVVLARSRAVVTRSLRATRGGVKWLEGGRWHRARLG
jgi:hypothetical protein